MKVTLIILITALFTTGCSSIGAYTEAYTETQVNFYDYSSSTGEYIKKQTSLKVAETGLVSGSTLLYSASGSNSLFNTDEVAHHVIYSLWINETEVDEVEFAIDKYRQWQEQIKPDNYSTTQPINEYVSQWMNGVTFKFSLINGKQGRPFLCVCYEFTELDSCIFTYMIDEQSVELLSEDLQKFKQQ